MFLRIRQFLTPTSGAPALLAVVLAAGFLAAAFLVPGFGTADNLLGLIAYLAPVLLLAIGMTLVVITGGIDLSVTAVVALVSVTAARVLTLPQVLTFPTVLQLVIAAGVALAVGLIIGLLNGFLITRTGMPSFIVTLAMMMLGSGVAVWSTGSQVIGGLPSGLLELGQRMSTAIGVAAAVLVLAELCLARTVMGRWLFAVGRNPVASLISAVPVRLVTLGAFVASSCLASLASLLLTARLETGSPVMGRELLLDAIGATVVGGTRLSGGFGRPLWTLVGVLFFAVLDNALNLLNVSYFAIMMIKGAVILVAAIAGSVKGRDAV
ncbi:MAG: ABC transporter permease [Opitutaceae bacterium]|nr:ABC transporter permease [Opitutaceae bacterium]